jgi:flagellar biosynthesis/type III secretory pathway protein FliH
MSVAQDRDMLRLYEMREMGMYDYTSGINNATRKGIAIGEQRGLQKGMQKGLQEGMQKGLQKGLQEGLQKGIQEGIQEGLQEGLQQARVNFVLNLSQNSMSVAEIAKLTGLTVEEVNHILNNNRG